MPGGPRDWDARTYDRVADPQTRWGRAVLGAHLERLPPAEHDQFVHEVASRLEEPLIDYVRLNITARRPEPTP